MLVLKSGGRVIGAKLTVAEQKAIDIEAKKSLIEYIKAFRLEIEARVLWSLHSSFGFGEERLRRFFEAFDQSIGELVEHYDVEDDDAGWLCVEKLRNYGIDLEKWENELEKGGKI